MEDCGLCLGKMASFSHRLERKLEITVPPPPNPPRLGLLSVLLLLGERWGWGSRRPAAIWACMFFPPRPGNF